MTPETNVTLWIDDIKTTVKKGTRLIDVADNIGIKIPRLCYHPDLSQLGACRVCLVEVEGQKNPVASCSTVAVEGMKVTTNSPLLRRLRRDIVELILDNHPKDCQTCERNGNCELQELAYDTGVRTRYFEGERKILKKDSSSPAVIRAPEKCIHCGRCVRVCAEVQNVYNLSQQYRGFNTVVAPAYEGDMLDSVCIQCGQCINVCPTAAFVEHNHTEEVFEALFSKNKHVVVQTAPSIRATIGEGFGYKPGTPNLTGKMVTALRMMGFDKVFDTDFAADLTIIEEAHEFIKRLTKGENLPLITSCSPGWVNYLERFYPEFIANASTCRSPMSMLSALIKTYYAEKAGIDPRDIYVVAIMPCTAKKFEARRPEHYTEYGVPYTDAVLTTRELIWMMKSAGIEMQELKDGDFDSPLGLASGAGDIFGTTGGVMEAALRTAYEKVTGEELHDVEFTQVRAVEGLREATIEIKDKKINVGVANGLHNAKVLLDRVKSKEKEYHMIEIMACPGGCIGGGGQPYPPEGTYVLDKNLTKKRAEALYTIDKGKTLRKSHDNPDIIKLYEEFLGEPLGKMSHKLLHTHYSPKLPKGITPRSAITK